jgi:hypothetical protein
MWNWWKWWDKNNKILGLIYRFSVERNIDINLKQLSYSINNVK